MRDSRLDSHRGSGTRGEKSVGASRTPSLTVHVHVAHVAHSLLTPPRISGTSAGARDTVARRRMGSPALPAVAQTANTLHQSAVLVAGTLNAHAVNPRWARRGPCENAPFILSFLAAKTNSPARIRRRSQDFGRNHVREGPSGAEMSPGRGLRTGSRTRWAFRRIYDAGAGILSFLAAKTRPPARIRRRSRDSRRDYVREGSSGEKTAPGPGVSTESRTRSALRRHTKRKGPRRSEVLIVAVYRAPTGCAYGSTGTPSSRR